MEFRDRAWFEAERYGADPWIFVRELMQNGRDAGARSVRFEVSERDGLVRLTCRDDGAGMTEAHARQFLFRLYASSKENQQGAAGRFGVGFWSILRFEPSQIVIRSWPKGGAPWEVTLDGALQRAASAQPLPRSHGTEVVLVKRLTPGVAEQVKRAARMHGRYLTTRADRHQPLQVTIDGEQVTQTMALPAPSATFERNGVRGVVGLGEVPGVELFSKGLHVRSASNVEELLSAPADEKGQGRKLDPMLDGLAPQVLLDGDHFSLVRSRSDARDDRALRKAVALSQRELARLIERQLQFSRPVPLLKRALRPALAAAAALAVLGGGAWVASALAGRGAPEGGLAASPLPSRGVTPAAAAAPLEPYRDPSTRYRGPRTDALPASPTFTDLQYWPQNQTLYFSALHLERPDDPAALAPRDVSERFPSRPCTTDCVRVALGLDAEQGWVRLPVPTGQVIDPATVVWNGAAARVYRTREGEPVVWAAGASRASVSYQTGPGLPPVAAPLHVPEVMPAEVPDVSALSTLDQVETLRRWVAEHVTYSNDPGVNARHRLHRRHGGDFVSRTLEVGAGYCDVQNALLAMLLQAADVRARLAVGYVGRNGAADPVLHAWVEYRAVDGWRVTDASAPLNAGAAKVAAAPPSVGPVPVAGRSVAYGATSWAAPLHAPQPTVPASPGWKVPPPAVGLLGLAPLLALVLVLLRPKVTRSVQLDASHDVSKLLQGALARPDAFANVPALFEQPLVPVLGRGPISLDRAYRLASAEKLYFSEVLLDLSRLAVEAGGVVLDARRPEGKVVAEALGAVNLDRWELLFRSTRVTRLLERVNAELHRRGEPWTVMVSAEVSREPAVLRVPGTKNERWVVINGDAGWLERAGELSRERPARALFSVIDQLAAWLRLEPTRRARLLAGLARAALLEDAGPGGPAPSGGEPVQQPVGDVASAEPDGYHPAARERQRG